MTHPCLTAFPSLIIREGGFAGWRMGRINKKDGFNLNDIKLTQPCIPSLILERGVRQNRRRGELIKYNFKKYEYLKI